NYSNLILVYRDWPFNHNDIFAAPGSYIILEHINSGCARITGNMYRRLEKYLSFSNHGNVARQVWYFPKETTHFCAATNLAIVGINRNFLNYTHEACIV